MEAGHDFLAKLGKTRLRPGGLEGTNWLLDKAQIKEGQRILEVATHQGRTMIELAKTYNCPVDGIDLNAQSVAIAEENIKKEGLEKILRVQRANAMDLPFEDETFDVVINEAMLTMLDDRSKAKCIAEYYRVLKPGGCLLTHDVCLLREDEGELKELRELLHIPVHPKKHEDWIHFFKEQGFKVDSELLEMSFLTQKGLLRDEGPGFFTLMKNAIKPENIKRFFAMKEFFDRHHKDIFAIVIYSVKDES